MLSVPLAQNLQDVHVSLVSLLTDGIFDYLCQSINPCPSPDQPGHGSCVYTALPLFSADPRVRQIINESYAKFNFSPLPVLHDSGALLIFSLCNCAYASKDVPESTFNQLMIKMNTNHQGIKHINHEDDFADSEV